MGFSIQSAIILSWLKSGNFIKAGDSVLEFGSQQINNDIIENLSLLDSTSKLFGVELFSKRFDWRISDRRCLASGMQHLPVDAPFAKELYEHLGLKYACVDIDGSPGSIKMDLNFDSVPKEHKGKYSLVTNLGTTEHIINQLNAFKAVHDFTSPRGFMVHSLPFQGFETHGLVNYTMKFFWLLARSNMYQVIDVDISAWKRTPMPGNILDFAKSNSRIFKSKDRIGKLELQDTGITVILQKRHNIEFVPPLDISLSTKPRDSAIKKRYWTVLDRDSLSMYVLRGKNFIKKMF